MDIPPPPADPDASLLSRIPVFEVVVGAGIVLAVAGLAFAAVPELRRRRRLWVTWVTISSVYGIAVVLNVVRLFSEFS